MNLSMANLSRKYFQICYFDVSISLYLFAALIFVAITLFSFYIQLYIKSCYASD
jgi:hypothetical protein